MNSYRYSIISSIRRYADILKKMGIHAHVNHQKQYLILKENSGVVAISSTSYIHPPKTNDWLSKISVVTDVIVITFKSQNDLNLFKLSYDNGGMNEIYSLKFKVQEND